MSRINNGGYAYPVTGQGKGNNGTWESTEFGMTLRDYFAAKALPTCFTTYCKNADFSGWAENWRDQVAINAYQMADAMLKLR